jgi:hypothetical protein
MPLPLLEPVASSAAPAPAAAPAVEPTPAAAPAGPSMRSGGGASPALPRGRPASDIGFVSLPSRSGLAGNSFLYLNLSNNELEGSIPESLGGMEMFRSPANSSDPFDM